MSHSFIHIILSAVILDILQYGHPLLREECGPVVHINRDILSFLDDMQETLAQGGIGLAAPQVGRPIQLVTINIPSTDATTTWLEVDGCPTTLSRIMPLNFINPILAGIITFSRAVVRESRLKFWKTNPMRPALEAA